MGTTASKQDRKTALQLCKGRLKDIEQAIDARYALSAAQLSYQQSLRNVGVALRQFVESHHEGDPEKSPCSSSALPSPSPPADNAKSSPLPVPSQSDVSRLRSAVSPSMTVTINPDDASFIKKRQPVPTSVSPPSTSESCPPWDFFEPNDVSQNAATHLPENCERTLDDFVHADGRDPASSMRNTSQIAEVQEQLGAHGCKELDDNCNHHKLNHNDCNEIEIADTHLPNDSSLEKGPDQVQTQTVEEQNPTSISDNRKNEAYFVDKVNVPKRSCSEREEDKGSFITSVSKDFLYDVKELERQFARAAESCHQVSRMLETRKIRLSVSSKIPGKPSCALSLSASLICCNTGNVASHESEQHVTKVIVWNRTLSTRSSLFSAQKDDDPSEICSDFVEEFCMLSGSHASSLDRLYAWERKIYDELKKIESIEPVYDKKCAQLSHQVARDADARKVDRTRVTLKELYSRIMVGTEALYSISKTIEKLRDEELQPQLLELLQGQTKMWRVLQEVHQIQQTITSQADAKLSAISPPSEPRGHAMMNLITELGFFYCSLAGWVGGYKNYVGGLHSWLQKCVVQPRDHSRGGNLTLSPRQHLAPPLFVLLGDLSEGIKSLPSQESFQSIKNLAAYLKKMHRHQAQHKAAKRSSDTGAERDRSETEATLATLQGGLTTMFDRLSKLSDAMASLAENVKREAEIAREAYAVGRRTE